MNYIKLWFYRWILADVQAEQAMFTELEHAPCARLARYAMELTMHIDSIEREIQDGK